MSSKGEFTMSFFMWLIVGLIVFSVVIFMLYNNLFPGAETLASKLRFAI